MKWKILIKVDTSHFNEPLNNYTVFRYMHKNGKEYTFLSSVPSLLVKNGSFYRLGFFFSFSSILKKKTDECYNFE